MDINKIFIAGAGVMGSGIAQVCAQAGFQVHLYDLSNEILEKALKNIRWSTGKLAEKGMIKESAESVINRIQISTSPENCSQADLIIEAVFEKIELKRDVLSLLGRFAQNKSIIASNTSTIPITELSSFAKRAEKTVGLHFFNPVPMIQVVEVIRGTLTSQETFEEARDFVIALGKEPLMVNKDTPGFVINRINLPSTIEAIRLLEQGIASAEDIDRGVRLALGRKMGIFETGDIVGLDVTCSALMSLYNETGDQRWFPPALLRNKVRAGHLGKKSGRGWYEYQR